jgi:hypothetical protein
LEIGVCLFLLTLYLQLAGIVVKKHIRGFLMDTQQNVRYEKKDVNVRMLFISGLAAIIIFIVILTFLSDYFTVMETNAVYETQLKPESVSLNEILKEEQAILTSYKLIDSKKGIYRIPIERAMQLLAEEAAN